MDSQSPPTIEDIINSRQWNDALFTTFPLSLSYFESVILGNLQRQKCNNIWIVTDQFGYKNALTERQSRHVGHDYRIVPVVLPNGVFHPKVIYLSSDEGDILVVGSGNLTFGGHGRNLECFEVFESNRDPEVFGDFNQFMDALSRWGVFKNPDSQWLTIFSDLSATAYLANPTEAVPSDTSSPRLLFSIGEPIVDQVARLLEGETKVESISALSPFHDGDGRALKRLAHNLRAKSLNVAAMGRQSPFPFSDAASWAGLKVRCVEPVINDPRPLHAKWFEFRSGDQLFTLTGSANATSQALYTVNNCELSVWRQWPASKQFFQMVERSIPEFAPLENPEEPERSSGLLYAMLDKSGKKLSGHVVTKHEEGLWEGTIHSANGISKHLQVQVQPEGDFSYQDEALSEFVFEHGVQLRISLGENADVRGWVHIESILTMPRLQSLSGAAMARILGGRDNQDDLTALLNFFSASISRYSDVFSAPLNESTRLSTKAGEDDKDRGIVSINLERLGTVPDEDAQVLSSNTSGEALRSVTAIRALRRALIGFRPKHNTGFEPIESDEIEIDEITFPSAEPVELELREFEEQLVELVKSSEHQTSKNALLSVIYETGLSLRLFRQQNLDAARQFISRWISFARNHGAIEENICALEQHFVGAVTIVTLAEENAGTAEILGRAHDQLERFYKGKELGQRCMEASQNPSFEHFFHAIMPEGNSLSARETLTKALKTPTVRQQLIEAYSAASAGTEIDEAAPVFNTDAGQRLLRAFRAKNWERKIAIVRKDTGDPCCGKSYDSFGRQERNDFYVQRFAECINCRAFTLNLSL